MIDDKYYLITKESILKKISEESIFKHLTGNPIELNEKIISPFRKDSNPGCWFDISDNGELLFKDFTNTPATMNAFEAVKKCKNLSSIEEALHYVTANINVIKNGLQNPSIISSPNIKPIKIEWDNIDILVKTRDFNSVDVSFWTAYGISKKNLEEDQVFAIEEYQLNNPRKKDIPIIPTSITYAYTGFKNNRKKLYSPYKKNRFITNCNKDDIGGIYNKNKPLIISKSYKDYRVLKNLSLNTCWFQNEGMFPNKEVIIDEFKNIPYIIVFFDCDTAGILASKKLKNYLKGILNTSVMTVEIEPQFLKVNIKDPSDYIKVFGEIKFRHYMKKIIR